MQRSALVSLVVLAALAATPAAHASPANDLWWPTTPSLRAPAGDTPRPVVPVLDLPIATIPRLPLYCPYGSAFDARLLVGLDRSVAEREAARNGCKLRVAILDGRHLTLLANLDHSRVNVEVVGREVVRVIDVG